MKQLATLFVAPTVRALIQVFAGSELVDEDTQSKVVGAVTLLVTVAWSIYEKQKANRKLSDARGTPTS
jgi:hypothetical protein